MFGWFCHFEFTSPLCAYSQYGVSPTAVTIKIGEQLCVTGETMNADPLTFVPGLSIHFILCNVTGQEAGPVDLSVTLSDSYYGYGLASYDARLTQVSPIDGSAFMFMQHGDITGLSASSGGSLGGTTLTIYGSGFSHTLSNNKVLVAGRSCEVVGATASSLSCVLPPAPSSTASSYAGGRGLYWEVNTV